MKKNFLSIYKFSIKRIDSEKSFSIYIDIDEDTVGVIKLHDNFLRAVKMPAKRPRKKG
ncbi:hypothetical protein [Pseudobacteriovorax antillogorgiicola]|uniref:Uncharacterized protein n=1 Tax=Pseudobacteriovorax antillogorgiicola TaxID=1513793 RepID=A0A1Y6B7U9_9BACT|nr:hypothetical protein [Pseudobacteriovorax antillogorgiicola]TCS58734.1 hypothetical protein EDD56_102248 [Pseudobacteriovorax antillogorgiicola]SME95280.1 hypothetical protein SAMN06296036_102195 [Pseudobacteriovorax antillogorgiicola]